MRTHTSQHENTYIAAALAIAQPLYTYARTPPAAVCGHICSSMRTHIQQHADTHIAACGHIYSSRGTWPPYSYKASYTSSVCYTYIVAEAPGLHTHRGATLAIKVLLRRYEGAMKALFRLYQGSIKALLRRCLRLYQGSNKALIRLYSGAVKALSRLYSGSIQALLRRY